VKKGKPKKVIEKDDVHYFYFPVEFGIGKSKILGLEIIIPLPIKFPDIEPVKVVKVGKQIQVVSRFHYNILTYFNRPELIQGKAIVDFSLGNHSPYVHSEKGSRLGANIAMERLDAIEARFAEFLVSAYWAIITGKMKLENVDLRDYEVNVGDVPEEVMFHPEDCHSVVWVGSFPEKNGTPTDIWNILADTHKS
jgi:hypothetical protein